MITVDARWIQTSGIGTYLKNILPGIIQHFHTYEFSLLGNRNELENLGFTGRRITIVDASAGMYSLREQIDYWKLIPRGTRLYFATHYNVPLFYHGPMLVTIYDLFHLAMPELVGGIHKRLYAKYMFCAVHRKASAIITISDFTMRELIRLTGPCKQPIYPIHLGVDKEWFSIPPGSRPHARPYVLYVGNIKPHKNLSRLVRAFSSIAASVPHDLILVGKREGFITGDSDVATLSRSLEDRIFFTGRVSDEALRQYFAHADSLAFPSLYEGFGLPPLEAMAANCPVLISNAGPMPEICGDAALYCDPYRIEDIAAKMMTLLSDARLRDSLRLRGLERARSFTWDRCVQQTCDVMRDLLDQPGEGIR